MQARKINTVGRFRFISPLKYKTFGDKNDKSSD